MLRHGERAYGAGAGVYRAMCCGTGNASLNVLRHGERFAGCYRICCGTGYACYLSSHAGRI
ncbi:MAG: hypothetical protein LBH17_05825 [Oscillospiraceae bacterium]|nr:hypothetical protein [Oscillospiraceae bacterium]